MFNLSVALSEQLTLVTDRTGTNPPHPALTSPLAVERNQCAAYNVPVVMRADRRTEFEQAVHGELAVLYRVARRLVRSPEEAEDLVQQTLMRAYGAWARFDGQHLRSWLIRILRNENLMRVRSNHRVEHAELKEDSATDEGFWNDIVWRDQADRILNALDEIPLDFRMTVVLCDVEQMSYEEAATILEIPVGTVRSRLSRGRAMIRARLKGRAQ